MKKSKNQSGESKDKIFDRIFKENAPSIFMPIIERELGIKIKSYETLPAELPRTIGRRVDFFCRIVKEDDVEELLHIEFQTADDYEMVERVGEYHGIMFRKYRLPIRHIVVFLGKGKSRMRTQLKEQEIYRGFDLLNISEMDSSKLLSSQVPEEMILAILGNYEEERIESILRFTLRKLKNLPLTEAQCNKYIAQLILISKLRNLTEITGKIINDMTLTYDHTQDYYYLKGIAAGEKKAQQEIEGEREKARQEREKIRQEREEARQEREKAKQEREKIRQEREKASQEREKAKQEREKIRQEREEAKQEKIESIQALLTIDNLSHTQIADIMKVTEKFVKQIANEDLETNE